MIRVTILQSKSADKLERMTNDFISYLEDTDQEFIGTSLMNNMNGIWYNQITYKTNKEDV